MSENVQKKIPLCGEQTSREQMSGEQMSGEQTSGEQTSGEQTSRGANVSGSKRLGEQTSGSKRLGSRWLGSIWEAPFLLDANANNKKFIDPNFSCNFLNKILCFFLAGKTNCNKKFPMALKMKG